MAVGYRELDVWNKAMDLVVQIYRIAEQLPKDERYGLISQIQRAAVSIPSNIAEGHGKGSGDFRRHVMIARGSLMELETQLELCVRLKLIDRERVISSWKITQDVGRMLTKLGASLKN